MGVSWIPARPAQYLERAARIRREEGLWRLSTRLCRRLLSPLVGWGSVTFFERRLDRLRPARPGPAGVTVREVHAGELAVMRDGLDPERNDEEIAGRFRRGDRAFGAFDARGRCIHTRWVTTMRTVIPEIDREIVPQPGRAYFYNGYTRPDDRGQGVDGAVRHAIFDTLGGEGYTAACSYVRSDNPAGFRAAERCQSPIARVRYLRIGRGITLCAGAGAGAVSLTRVSSGEREAAWRKWFDAFTVAPLPARSTGCDALPEAYFQSAAAFIADTLRLRDGDHVLDVGCDSAMITRLIAPRCARLTGVDMIPGMLKDARDLVMPAARAGFVAADGRRLPLASGVFDKTYCSAVIHALPEHADGMAVIDELIRVTADGGTVLVSSVPDRAKQWANAALVWRRAAWLERLTLPMRWVLPASWKQVGRRVLRRPQMGPPAFLAYDVRAIARLLRSRGLVCEVVGFPPDYWSTDFRATRSNLLILKRRAP